MKPALAKISLYLIFVYIFIPFGIPQARANATIPSNPCEAWVNGRGNGQGTTAYGIGVLGLRTDGIYVLGVSSYFGSRHGFVADALISGWKVIDLLWFGELEYRLNGEFIQLIRANETSGDYLKSVEEAAAQKSPVRYKSIPTANSVLTLERVLPPSLLDPLYRSIPFDPKQTRIIPYFNTVQDDPRHNINNLLAVVRSSSISLVTVPVRRNRKDIVRIVQEGFREKFETLGWMLRNVFREEGSSDETRYPHVLAFIEKVLNYDFRADPGFELEGPFLEIEFRQLAAEIPPNETRATFRFFLTDQIDVLPR